MGRLPDRVSRLEETKRENLKVLYPAIHKEFTDLRTVPFRVATIYGSFSVVVLGWTFSNRNAFGILEVGALLLLLILIAGYSLQFLKSMEVHQQEVGEALNKMQILWKVFDAGFYATSFQGREGDTLFPLNWTLTGLSVRERAARRRSFPEGTAGRDIGFIYARYFVILMFVISFAWVALLLVNQLVSRDLFR